MSENYVGTFWRSTDMRYKYSVFAVVFQRGAHLHAWEMEIRGNNVYHPAYGLISRSNIDEIDVFTTSAGSKTPSFSFNTTERGFYFAGDNLQNIIWLPVT